jgi:hypothetical protein
MKTHINKVILVAIVALQAAWLVSPAEGDEPNPKWATAILNTRVVPANRPVLDVWCTQEISGELVGCCTLANVESGSYKPVRMVIKGQRRNGLFWPTVMSQVSDLAKGPWRTIHSGRSERGAARVVLEPGDRLTELRVSLEPFREYIGKYEVGRIVLTSGDSGIFELSSLKPPK